MQQPGCGLIRGEWGGCIRGSDYEDVLVYTCMHMHTGILLERYARFCGAGDQNRGGVQPCFRKLCEHIEKLGGDHASV